MYVIGVAGQAQHGKDTTADYLAAKMSDNPSDGPEIVDLGIVWERTAFALNVKKVFCDTFDVDLEFVEKWKTIPEPPPGFDMPVRQALQFIGDGFRKIRGTIWLDLAFRDMTRPKIISDVRYRNEWLRIKAEKGLNLLVGRTDRLNDDPNGSEAQVRPYVEWCLNYYKGRNFVMFPGMGTDGKLIKGAPEHMLSFDLFVRNDGTTDELRATLKQNVIPFIKLFKF